MLVACVCVTYVMTGQVNNHPEKCLVIVIPLIAFSICLQTIQLSVNILFSGCVYIFFLFIVFMVITC